VPIPCAIAGKTVGKTSAGLLRLVLSPVPIGQKRLLPQAQSEPSVNQYQTVELPSGDRGHAVGQPLVPDRYGRCYHPVQAWP